MTNQMASAPTGGGEAAKVNVINFTVKTAYTPSKAAGGPNSTTTASAPAAATPAAPVQVAKN